MKNVKCRLIRMGTNDYMPDFATTYKRFYHFFQDGRFFITHAATSGNNFQNKV